MMVIAEMLGIPSAEWRHFRRWSCVIVTSSSLAVPGGAQWPATAEDMKLVAAEMKDSLREWIGERRPAPKDDLLTALVQADVDGECLSEEELLGFLQPLAIEEVLRYRSPVQWMLRLTARDVEIGGRHLPAGKRILIMIGSANKGSQSLRRSQPLRYCSRSESAPRIRPRHPLPYLRPALAVGKPGGALGLSRPHCAL